MAYKARKRKVKKNVPEGQAHIHVTYNNTIITITDMDGNTEVGHQQVLLDIRVQRKRLHLLQEWLQKQLQRQHMMLV